MTPPNELEKLAEFKTAIQSNKGLERLRAMQYLQQMNNQGLMGMPQVTEQPVVQRSNGGKVFNNLDEATAANLPPGSKFFIADMPETFFVDADGAIGKEIQEGMLAGLDAYTPQDIGDGSISPEDAIAYNKYLRNISQSNQDRPQYNRRIDAEQYGDIGAQGRAGGGQVAPDSMAQGLAGLGRNGDSMLLHINPEELEGLASVGEITYNPITGLPEAWGFKSFFKPFKQAFKSVKKVAKSKAFRMIAPLALTIAAPYLAASFFPATFGVAGVTGGLAAQVAAMGPVAFGAATAMGSGLGALAGGAKPKDALKAAAMSGITAGGMRGFTNYMDPNINSVYGPTYGSNAAGNVNAVGKVGNLTTTFKPDPSVSQVANKPGVDFGQYGSTDSLVSPDYYSGGGNQFVNTADIGAGSLQMDPSLLQTNIPATPAYSGNASNMTGGKYSPVSYAAQDARTINLASNAPPSSAPVATSPTAYDTLYGTNQAGQLTLPGGDAGGRFSTGGSNDSIYTVGSDLPGGQYTPPSIKDQAMDALTDNKVGRAVSKAGDYLEGTKVGDIGGAMYDDFSTAQGLGKLAIIDSQIPDYAEDYAMQDERKRQIEELEKLGFDVELSDEETGFNQTVVVRDSSGKVMPQNLTLQDLIDRAYGRTPRTMLTDTISYKPATATAKNGGLINLAGGGNFSGMVQGNGHGMEDNVYMPIEEQGQQVGTLAVSPSEYVVDAYTMSALGNGNANEGAKVMDGVVESVRKKAYGTMRQPNEINGLQALKPMMMGV